MARTVGQTQLLANICKLGTGGGYGYRFTLAARLGYPYHFKQRQHPNLALMLIKIVWAPSHSLSVSHSLSRFQLIGNPKGSKTILISLVAKFLDFAKVKQQHATGY